MKIRLKLYATLTDYLPSGSRDNVADLEVADAATVAEALAPFGLPPRLIHLVLINGSYVPPEARAQHRLRAGDELAVWPPVAGG